MKSETQTTEEELSTCTTQIVEGSVTKEAEELREVATVHAEVEEPVTNPKGAGRKQKGWYQRPGFERVRIAFPFEGYCIYGLASTEDPSTIRYIGYTSMKLNGRYNEHIADSKRFETEKSKWVRDVLEKGFELIMIVLKEGIKTRNQACAAEKRYIKLFRYCGADLTNMTNGGTGALGLIKTLEMKKRHSDSMIQFLSRKKAEQIPNATLSV